MPRPAQDLTGRRFGYLTMLQRCGSNRWGKALWRARCDCGTEITVVSGEMTRKRGAGTRSCGCKRGILMIDAKGSHGMSSHPAYAVWRSMCDRCRLPSHQAWHNYGARGIRVCAAWQERFENFWSDMGASYRPGLTLERRDNDGHYIPENCYWATHKTQARNTRRSRLIDTPWGRMTVAEASERSGIGHTTILYRLGKGWSPERLLEPPSKANRFSTS